MSSSGWDQMAEWWDNHLGEEGDLWHRALIDPRCFASRAREAGSACWIWHVGTAT